MIQNTVVTTNKLDNDGNNKECTIQMKQIPDPDKPGSRWCRSNSRAGYVGSMALLCLTLSTTSVLHMANNNITGNGSLMSCRCAQKSC